MKACVYLAGPTGSIFQDTLLGRLGGGGRWEYDLGLPKPIGGRVTPQCHSTRGLQGPEITWRALSHPPCASFGDPVLEQKFFLPRRFAANKMFFF